MSFQDDARAQDAADPLIGLRQAFRMPEGRIYLNGNSLGPLTVVASHRMTEVVETEWAVGLTAGWNAHDWMGAPFRIGRKIARLIGADPHEVLCADSTSVNIFKLASAALKVQSDRSVVLSEPGDFPSDLYVLDGVVRTLGGGRRIKLRPAEEIEAALTEEVALLVLGHVHYKTGGLRDMARLTAKAHSVGTLVLWDLSHSAGVLDVDLNGARADLAVGCGYKYLNGGPGAPAFLYVAERHQELLRSPLQGWMGHALPFAFDDAYTPAPGVGRFACGTPSILAMAALEAGVDVAGSAGGAAMQRKARGLGDLFMRVVEAGPAARELELISPRDPEQRGGHVAYRHPDSYAIVRALISRGITGDFREPDVMRFGFSPLFLSHVEVAVAAAVLGDVVSTRAYDDPTFRQRLAVT